MSEEDLELLITLDDPRGAPEEDTFKHPQAKNTLEYWLGQPFTAKEAARPKESSGDTLT